MTIAMALIALCVGMVMAGGPGELLLALERALRAFVGLLQRG
jgi:hypothetical protein